MIWLQAVVHRKAWQMRAAAKHTYSTMKLHVIQPMCAVQHV